MYSNTGGNYSYTSQSQYQGKPTLIEPTPDVAALKYGGLTDVNGAKTVARKLFEMYDRDRDGNISNIEVAPMITDAYQSLNRSFSPNKQDIDAFFKICDRNKDGRINYEDLESLCLKYLTTGYLSKEMGFR